MWNLGNLKQPIYLIGAFIITLNSAPAMVLAPVSSTGALSGHQKTNPASEITTVTKKDQDSTIHMKKGGILAVRLEWTPGTGYSWALENSDNKIFLPHGKSIHEPAKKSMPGASESIVFNYKAVETGSSTLKFALKRRFEKNAEPIDHFMVNVEVAAK